MFQINAPVSAEDVPKQARGSRISEETIATFAPLFEALRGLEPGNAIPVTFEAPVVPTEKNQGYRPEYAKFCNNLKQMKKYFEFPNVSTLMTVNGDVVTVYVRVTSPSVEA